MRTITCINCDLLLLVAAAPAGADSGAPLGEASVLEIRRGPARAAATPAVPVLDGRLDEPVWRSAVALGDFVQASPAEGRPATERTEVRILYGQHALYLGFRCEDSHASELRPRLARRDN